MEIISDKNLVIYPNATSEYVTISMSSITTSKDILDPHGKLITINQTVIKGDKTDLSKYETGMYIFRVKTDKGVI